MKTIIIFLLIVFCYNLSFSQEDTLKHSSKVYKLNYGIDVPLTAVGFVASKIGTDYLRGRDYKHIDRIGELRPKDVWWIDRSATFQDPEKYDRSIQHSNNLMRGAMFLPAVMFLDSKVRDIWLDYSLLYLEAQSINAMAYLAGAIPIPRLRPFMYNPDVPMDRKLGRNTTNSFFSGHTSVVATSTFFMVKVYHDLHPEAKNKALWYGIAAVPPLVTGYFRYRASKHFLTDVFFGLGVGAATGILVPEWHKIKGNKLSVYPSYSRGVTGFFVQLKI